MALVLCTCSVCTATCSEMSSLFLSDRTGLALRRYSGRHQRDPDRVHHTGTAPGGLAPGAEDPRHRLGG